MKIGNIGKPDCSKRKRSENNKDDKSKKKRIEESTSNQRICRKPFDKLLEGVKLVISGIQNPDRANLRSMALEMGSKYKGDWDNTCTHLVCAFTNTPKFNQVRGKGKIVTKKWVEDCYNQRKRLPWRRYCLDKNDTGAEESEEEIWEDTGENKADSEDDTNIEHLEDASDTEDRIATIMQSNNESTISTSVQEDNPVDNDEETDVEELETYSGDIKDRLFMDFFMSKTFYIDLSMDKELVKTINKYIVAYSGTREDDPTDAKIDFYITKSPTDIKNINPDGVCVSPDWIWECHNQQQLIALDNYILK